MLFNEALIPLLALASMAEAQGINFKRVYSKKPALAKATNSKATKTNVKATAASIISQLNAQKTASALHSGAAGVKAALSANILDTSSSTCAAQSITFNYIPTPNTPAGFLTDSKMNGLAKTATTYPAGYSVSFLNQYASLSANNYITETQLSSYNTTACAAFCDSVTGCTAFNIYFERTPTLDPGVGCENPTSSSVVRCALWGSTVSAAQALNIGEWRTNFMVVVQGSNGYTKNPTPNAVSGFSSPIALTGAIDVTSGTGKTSFIGSQFYNQAFNPQLCANYCTGLSASNKAAAKAAGQTTYAACNYFNVVTLSLSGVAQGTYCQAYTTDVSSYASLYTSTVNSVSYDLLNSYGYNALANDGGLVAATISSTLAATTTAVQTTTSAVTTPVVTTASTTPFTTASTTPSTTPSTTSSTTPSTTPSTTASTTPSTTASTTKSTTASSTSSSTALSTTTPSTTITTASRTTATSITSATPTGVTCANLGSNTYYDLNGIQYTTKCGYDLLGVGDVGMAVVSKYSDCFTACDVKSTCSGFAFVAGTPAFCYMKNLNGVTVVPNANANVDLAWLPANFTDRSSTASHAKLF